MIQHCILSKNLFPQIKQNIYICLLTSHQRVKGLVFNLFVNVCLQLLIKQLQINYIILVKLLTNNLSRAAVVFNSTQLLFLRLCLTLKRLKIANIQFLSMKQQINKDDNIHNQQSPLQHYRKTDGQNIYRIDAHL